MNFKRFDIFIIPFIVPLVVLLIMFLPLYFLGKNVEKKKKEQYDSNHYLKSDSIPVDKTCFEGITYLVSGGYVSGPQYNRAGKIVVCE